MQEYSSSQGDENSEGGSELSVPITIYLKQQNDLYNESDEDDHVMRKPSGRSQYKLSKNNKFSSKQQKLYKYLDKIVNPNLNITKKISKI